MAYTLLYNHIPLNGYLIGAHEYEAHHVLDIWYRSTSDIVPTVITCDMRSVNKANFAILHWFGCCFEPRFTDLNDQLQALYCADNPELYENFLIKPINQIDIKATVGTFDEMEIKVRQGFGIGCNGRSLNLSVRFFPFSEATPARTYRCFRAARDENRGGAVGLLYTVTGFVILSDALLLGWPT